jgi:hypothetical protein
MFLLTTTQQQVGILIIRRVPTRTAIAVLRLMILLLEALPSPG